MSRRSRLLVTLLVAAVFVNSEAHAHEIGTTRVAISFPASDSYLVEITADASAILARLEAASGRPRSGALTRRVSGTNRSAARRIPLACAHRVRR
jgi:hypothetical protein